MMMTLVTALLTVTPVPGEASLLEPAATERAASLHLAAATPEAAPVSEFAQLDARLSLLTSELNGVDRSLKAINTDWPGLSIAGTVFGSTILSLGLFALPAAAFSSDAQGAFDVPLLVVGAGAAMTLAGVISGVYCSSSETRRRGELLGQRRRLVEEMRTLTARREGLSRTVSERPRVSLPVATVAF